MHLPRKPNSGIFARSFFAYKVLRCARGSSTCAQKRNDARERARHARKNANMRVWALTCAATCKDARESSNMRGNMQICARELQHARQNANMRARALTCARKLTWCARTSWSCALLLYIYTHECFSSFQI